MVSPARKRRAWILLLVTWAVIAGVLAGRAVSNRRAEQARFDREAQEQAALRAMDKLLDSPPPSPPAAAEPEQPGTQPPDSEPDTPSPQPTPNED